MATHDSDGLEDHVRARLVQARFERGLSTTALARAAGVAPSTVSRLETGARRLTLAHVDRLASAMSLPVDELLGSASTLTTRVPGHDGRTWQAIGPERTRGARVYRVGLPATSADEDVRRHSHEGHQWLYVLAGTARLIVDSHDIALAEGESVEFHTWRPHWLGAIGGPAEVLVVFTPDGRPLRNVSLPE